ncbi:class I SAM-dependent methyltransferase [Dyella acidiphila]|uniref:Class I SAM-dependent methyltransferase n=1 Tax=Dyella acidiphila TaxID=2775866 RepID=A0ABR9GFE1_9GAMM|nr:class I SAM-dependent methyltransferase [Dyella acidiphila]MBE1162761.1 class I SAM-dependent methyltransferase [Dyella acidiphila]
MNFRQLAYGLLSYLPVSPDLFTPKTGGTDSAEYCYCVWLRQLVLAANGGMTSFPQVIAELGPGDSLGVGMAALISGVERYYAFDAVPHANRRNDLAIFDRLVELFRARTPIPSLAVFPAMVIGLPSYDFPSHVLTEQHMQEALRPARIEALREQLASHSAETPAMAYRAPWQQPAEAEFGKVDLLISNAVLEHVEHVGPAYRAVRDWLKPEGWSAHQIDFRSHSLFQGWDGHWACPDWLWRLMQGRRAYLLNREPYSTHVRAIQDAGLTLLQAIRAERQPERKKLARRFAHMDGQDRSTSMVFVVLRKPAS